MTSYHNLKCSGESIWRQALMVFLIMQMVGVSKVVQCFHVPSIAFQQPQRPTMQQLKQPLMRKNVDDSYRRIFSNLNMILSPDQIHDLFISASMQHGLDTSNHLFNNNQITAEISAAMSPSHTGTTSEITQWISDASTTADMKDDGGWWKAYINVFKSILTFVHTTIDGPFRSLGIEQTWGVSIFLFTASK